MRSAIHAAWAGLLACLLPGLQGVAAEQIRALDPERTHLGFELRPRFGQRLEGQFTRYDGTVQTLPDGRHQVRLRMYTASALILNKPRYTSWMRGPYFFDAEKFPVVEFDSLPYSPAVLAGGGDLPGILTIRGISRPETLQVQPSGCAQPGVECDVVVRGNVQRSRYGMDNWELALGDRVTLVLRSRLQESSKP